MANEIKAKFGTPTAMTITLAELASSTSRIGLHTDIVDNSSVRAQIIHLYVGITVGTNPTANKNIYIHLIKSDGTLRTDSAAATTGAWSQTNARLIGVIRVDVATSSVQYQGEFTIYNPGLEWGIGLYHDTGVNLHVTESLSVLRFTTENPEVQ